MIGFRIQVARKRNETPGGLGLSVGFTPRQIVKSVKRYALLLGIVVLALSTACAPVTRTAHVSTVTPYYPKDASQHDYVVNTSEFSIDSASIMASKLEVLFEGQKFSVDSSSYMSHVDPNQSAFNIDADGPLSAIDMQSEVMASVATELGIMSDLADGGLLLASAANLFPELETETDPKTEVEIGSRTGTQAANATSTSTSLSAGALAQSGAGSSNSSTTNPVIGLGSSIAASSVVGNSDNNGSGGQTAAPEAVFEPAPPAPVVTAPVVTAPVVTEPVEEPEQVEDKSSGTPDAGETDTSSSDDDEPVVVTDEEPIVVALFEPSSSDSPGNSNSNGNSVNGNSSSGEADSSSGDNNSSETDQNDSSDVAPALATPTLGATAILTIMSL